MWTELTRPPIYREQIEALHAKYGNRPRLHQLQREGVSLADIVLDQGSFARRLAADVRRGAYDFSPAIIKRVRLDKDRDVFCFDAADWIVHGAVARVLGRVLEPSLSPALYSYRPGRSPWRAARDLAAFVRRHRDATPNPRRRGLYVLRADIAQYGDSIPVGGRSPLWDQLRRAFAGAPARLWPLLESVVRPPIENPDEGRSVRAVGVPTGSPISNVLTNLYLDPVDRELTGIEGGFYARYGDDVVFAHRDPEVTREATARFEALARARGLELHAGKRRTLFFNGAGRASPAWPEAQGTPHLVYLGCRIDFSGTVGLPADKGRAVVSEMRRRLRRGAKLTAGRPLTDRARAACRMVGAAVDPSSPLAIPYADLLANAVTDRAQLQELDYRIALAVAQSVSGVAGVRAFRALPYRRMRRQWRLVSLVDRRNRDYRKRGRG